MAGQTVTIRTFHSKDISEDYEQKGLSLRQISDKTFHSKSTITLNLKQQNVILCSPRNAHGNPSQLRFGFRKTEQEVIPHRGEQHVAGMIQDFRSEGLTLREIAKRLTSLRIPSKNGKYKWHPMMVKRITGYYHR